MPKTFCQDGRYFVKCYEELTDGYQINTRHFYNICTASDQRRRRWADINTRHLYNICTASDKRRRRWADVVQMFYKCVFVLVCPSVWKLKCLFLSHRLNVTLTFSCVWNNTDVMLCLMRNNRSSEYVFLCGTHIEKIYLIPQRAFRNTMLWVFFL